MNNMNNKDSIGNKFISHVDYSGPYTIASSVSNYSYSITKRNIPKSYIKSALYKSQNSNEQTVESDTK